MDQAKIKEIVEGPIGAMIETSNLIISALYLKSKSKKDRLLIKALRDKLTEDYITTIVEMYQLVNLEVRDEIRQQLESWIKIRDGKKSPRRWFCRG